jgi:hypothetical protein
VTYLFGSEQEAKDLQTPDPGLACAVGASGGHGWAFWETRRMASEHPREERAKKKSSAQEPDVVENKRKPQLVTKSSQAARTPGVRTQLAVEAGVSEQTRRVSVVSEKCVGRLARGGTGGLMLLAENKGKGEQSNHSRLTVSLVTGQTSTVRWYRNTPLPKP